MRFKMWDTAESASLMLPELVSGEVIWERLRFPDMAEHLPLGIVLLNRRLELERFNNHYAAYIDAYSPCGPGEAAGLSYFYVVPGSDKVVGDWFHVIRQGKKKVTGTGAPLPVRTAKGVKTTYWDFSLIPVLSRRGHFSGIVMMTHEVTEQVTPLRARGPKGEKPETPLGAMPRLRHRDRGSRRPYDPIKRSGLVLEAQEAQRAARLALSFRLTPREIQVARLLTGGYTSKEIADALFVSTACVEFHRNNIREKLGLKHTGVNLATFLMTFLDS